MERAGIAGGVELASFWYRKWQADDMMDAKTYLKISGINLVFLLIGLALGALITILTGTVHAQSKQDTPAVAAKADQAKAREVTPSECEHAECITPGVGMPSAAIGILLANRAAFDDLTVNGYNLLKLHDATLAALQAKGIFTKTDVEAIVGRAKVEKPLRVRPQAQ